MREIRDLLIDKLKSLIYSELIKKVFGAMVGLRARVLWLIFDLGWKRYVKPAINYLFRKAEKKISTKRKQLKSEKINNAKTKQEYIDTLNSDTDI